MADADHSSQINTTFDFLCAVEVQRHFADLNMSLLEGRHIQRRDINIFSTVSNFKHEFTGYYQQLYGLNLVEDRKDGETYFYLDFPEGGKGKLTNQSRYKYLTDVQIIYGLMLLNLYYDRVFAHPKEIHWADIYTEIVEGEYSSHYRKLLFGADSKEFTLDEFDKVKKRLRTTLRDFDKLGWVERLGDEEGENIHFNINESIHRFAKLYEYEITHFSQFIAEYEESIE